MVLLPYVNAHTTSKAEYQSIRGSEDQRIKGSKDQSFIVLALGWGIQMALHPVTLSKLVVSSAALKNAGEPGRTGGGTRTGTKMQRVNRHQ